MHAKTTDKAIKKPCTCRMEGFPLNILFLWSFKKWEEVYSSGPSPCKVSFIFCDGKTKALIECLKWGGCWGLNYVSLLCKDRKIASRSVRLKKQIEDLDRMKREMIAVGREQWHLSWFIQCLLN